jgi:hypothetical protein
MSLITQSELDADLNHLSVSQLRSVVEHCPREHWGWPDLLLAVSSRETNVVNEVGDDGHGRGAWQIDDRTWGSWLKSVPGCRSGSWNPQLGTNALEAGYCPTLEDGLLKAVAILKIGWDYAIQNEVPTNEAARVMVASYNCGPGNALAGWRQDRNPDAFTTGGNYSWDCLGREGMVHDYLIRNKLIKP